MRRRAAREEGMTVIEVMVAALILAVGITAAVTALNGTQRLSLQAERKQQALSYAQADIERFRSLPYASIGTQTLPASGDAGDPSVLVITSGGQQVLRVKPLISLVTDRFPFNRLAPAAANGLPQSEAVQIGSSRGTVSRIVAFNDTCALNTVCIGPATAKRVTVVVQLDAVGGRARPAPVVAETIITNTEST